jgi:hypothetical protein
MDSIYCKLFTIGVKSIKGGKKSIVNVYVSIFESLDYLKVLLIVAPFVSWNENCTQVLHVLLEKHASLALCKGFYKACVFCERKKQKKKITKTTRKR